MQKGFLIYITLEGPDLSGKSSTWKKIRQRTNQNSNNFSKMFDETYFITEPYHGSLVGKNIIRPSLKDKKIKYHAPGFGGDIELKINNLARQYFFGADRIIPMQHLSSLRKEAEEQNKKVLVLSDRSFFSTVSYTRLTESEKYSQAFYTLFKGLCPKFSEIIILDVSLKEAKKRKKQALKQDDFSHDEIFDKMEIIKANRENYELTRKLMKEDFKTSRLDTSEKNLDEVVLEVEKRIKKVYEDNLKFKDLKD